MKACLDDAFDLFEAGNVELAEDICRKIIVADEVDAGARYLLGTILCSKKKFEEAIIHLKIAAAYEKNPKVPALFNLAISYCRIRAFREAEHTADLYCEKVRDDPSGLLLKAEIKIALGDPTSALQLCEAQIRDGLITAECTLIMAKALDQLGQKELAIQRLLLIADNETVGHDAKCYLGFLYLSTGSFEAAISVFQKAINRSENIALALSGIGLAEVMRGDITRGLSYTARAAEIAPHDSEVLTNQALSLQRAGQSTEAKEVCDRSLFIDQNRTDTYLLKSSISYEECDFVGAINAASRAIECSPTNHDAHYMRGIMELLLGRFPTGWQGYEHRLDASWTSRQSLQYQTNFIKSALRYPTKESLSRKRILLIEEQGIGDTIMFSGMLHEVAMLSSRLEVVVDRRLLNLMNYSFPTICFHSPDYLEHHNSGDFDHHLFLGSLGHALRHSWGDFPRRNYLHPRLIVIEKWQEYLKQKCKQTVGISWRGGTTNTNSKGRELPLTCLQPLLENQNFTFVVLQHGATEEEVKLLQKMTDGRIMVPAQHDIEDIENLAGLISTVDEVITAQNTNVHICGALGRSCHAVMPRVPTWSYGASGQKMPWYPSVTLYRPDAQTSATDLIHQIVSRMN